MSIATAAAITGLVGTFSLVAKGADRYYISAPMAFITIGAFMGLILRASGQPVVGRGTGPELLLIISEITLVVILFHDASTINFKELYIGIPLRLLTIGLCLTLLLLYFTTRALLPDVGVFGALLIAAALTPTDAGLGAPTILNPKVPSRIRQALNVESGMNDGMITPVVLIALAGLENEEGSNSSNIPQVALIPVTIAIGLAIFTAPFFALALDYAFNHRISTHAGRSTALVMLPLTLWALSHVSGANGFIAAFVGGAIFGYCCKLTHADHALSELLEAVADFLNDIAWFLAGELLVYSFSGVFKWQWILIAFLALVPFRMIPVYLSLIGSGLDFTSMSFLGWFGPRGIATVIFALLTLESLETASFDEDGEGREEEHDAQNITKEIVGALLFTVLISVFAHGYSAAPLAEMYAAYMAKKKKEGRPVTIDLDLPDITVRMRGTARNTSIPPEVLQARSLNMSRLRSERDLLMDRQASAQMEVKVNEDGTITAASLNIEPCEDSDTTIHLPYTKTANTTLIRSGSLQLEPLNFSHTNENNYDHLAAIREASTEDMNISFHDALKHENKTEIVEKNDV